MIAFKLTAVNGLVDQKFDIATDTGAWLTGGPIPTPGPIQAAIDSASQLVQGRLYNVADMSPAGWKFAQMSPTFLPEADSVYIWDLGTNKVTKQNADGTQTRVGGGFLDGALAWVSANPLLAGLGVVGLLLVTKRGRLF